ncbi:MAG TPA: AraC family transcriptional regulator [Opitutaceae bacterium]|nr:AraC family transcriptional regulator [Opitutaceae bacterium]
MSDTLHTSLQRIGAAASEVMILCDALEDSPLWLKDVKGRYQWVNRSFLLNFGFENRDDVLGRSDYDLCSLQLAEQYRVDDERVLAGERIVGRVELIGRYDHTSRWCSTTKIPLHDRKGKVVGTAGITRPLSITAGVVRHEPMSLAIRLISEQVGRSPTNADLARACGLSQRAFERQFHAHYRCTPQIYIRQLRARLSCHALVNSRKSMAEISTEFGYADQSHFNREFRRFMGETPGSYRERHQR